jgi:cytochrome c oxidase assembly protein subunit 15
VSPRAYERVTLLALVSLAVIIVTGGAVRLTGSGLGCSDWPACESNRLVAPWQVHPMVEFVNRVFTGLVSVAVILAVLGALLRVPRRRDLTVGSLALVAGVVAQIVLGGIAVLTSLNPFAVQAHFLLSAVIAAIALWLHHRAAEPDGDLVATVPAALRRWCNGLVAGIAVVIVTGTFVTGAGPHGGDERARRFDVSVHDVARIHGTTVMVFLGLVLFVMYRARTRGGWAVVQGPLTLLLWVLVVQGAIGYTQYFTGVQPLLVVAHIAGATGAVLATMHLALACRAPGARGVGQTEAAGAMAPASSPA